MDSSLLNFDPNNHHMSTAQYTYMISTYYHVSWNDTVGSHLKITFKMSVTLCKCWHCAKMSRYTNLFRSIIWLWLNEPKATYVFAGPMSASFTTLVLWTVLDYWIMLQVRRLFDIRSSSIAIQLMGDSVLCPLHVQVYTRGAVGTATIWRHTV